MNRKNGFWGMCSFGLAILLTLFILNFFVGIIPTSFQGMPILLTPIIGIAGMILGYIGATKYDDRLSQYGIIYNIILFFFPFVYWFLGTIIGGP